MIVGEMGDDQRDADRGADVADQRPDRGAVGAPFAGQGGEGDGVERHEDEPRPTPWTTLSITIVSGRDVRVQPTIT